MIMSINMKPLFFIGFLLKKNLISIKEDPHARLSLPYLRPTARV